MDAKELEKKKNEAVDAVEAIFDDAKDKQDDIDQMTDCMNRADDVLAGADEQNYKDCISEARRILSEYV